MHSLVTKLFLFLLSHMVALLSILSVHLCLKRNNSLKMYKVKSNR